MANSKTKPQGATAQEIRAVLGPTDDELVMAIRDTGATKGEVVQAFEWLDDDSYMGKHVKKKMDATVRRVHELLVEDREKGEGHDQ